jgi:iron complex transport system permease protein
VGGAALVICDTAARTLWAPSDLPVGIIVSFLGAPFFFWLLFGRKKW